MLFIFGIRNYVTLQSCCMRLIEQPLGYLAQPLPLPEFYVIIVVASIDN